MSDGTELTSDTRTLIQAGNRGDDSEGGDYSDSGHDQDAAPAVAVVDRKATTDFVVARALFFGGFALLPFLWLVAWLHFRRAARQPGAHPQLATYVRGAAIGASVGCARLACWFVTVRIYWRSWGEAGRAIMLVMPEDDEL